MGNAADLLPSLLLKPVNVLNVALQVEDCMEAGAVAQRDAVSLVGEPAKVQSGGILPQRLCKGCSSVHVQCMTWTPRKDLCKEKWTDAMTSQCSMRTFWRTLRPQTLDGRRSMGP